VDIIIAVDAMGCDAGIGIAIEGAIAALENPKITKIILVGPEGEIAPILSKLPHDAKRVEVVHAAEVIRPDEAPTVAIKTKKDSSLIVGLNLLKQGRAAAFVSAGSTGALLAGATIIVGRIRGIKRPALCVPLPNTATKGYTFLMDAGANVDCKPEFLLQFAQMASVYIENILGVSNPRVGLVNIGAEKEKGNALTKETYELLEASNLNFKGNIEARDISYGVADVVVCDGFVGNIILKTAEGYAKGIFSMLKEELMASLISKLGAGLSKGAFVRIRKRFDYTETGGAPFIGLNGLVVKAHGSSNVKAFKNSIAQCAKFIEADVVGKIKEMTAANNDGAEEGVKEDGI
jgi:glycerol-3-phosphate acyltransferase PlsX